jgi:hypothetical protein
MSLLPNRKLPKFDNVLGIQAAQPTSGSVELRTDFNRATGHFRLKFTLNAARLPVTDAAGSGSSASLKLFTFIKGAIGISNSRLNLVSCVVSSAVDTGAGDVAYILACGSVAADAGDGALTGTEVDVVPATATITNSGGTGAGSKIGALGSTAALDGTVTAKDVYLNWSGSAATCDANGTYDFTGTITICGQLVDGTET